jgi:hypothetical protein
VIALSSRSLARAPAPLPPLPSRSARDRNKHDRGGLSWRTAILSPSPRAWPAMLGAADMPIGCAITFYFVIPGRRNPPSLAGRVTAGTSPLQRRARRRKRRACHRTALRAGPLAQSRNDVDYYSVAWRSVGLRSR